MEKYDSPYQHHESLDMRITNRLKAAQLICDVYKASVDLQMYVELLDNQEIREQMELVQAILLGMFHNIKPTRKELDEEKKHDLFLEDLLRE